MLMIRRDYIRNGLMIEDLINKFNATSKALGDHVKVIQQLEEENYFKQKKIAALADENKEFRTQMNTRATMMTSNHSAAKSEAPAGRKFSLNYDK